MKKLSKALALISGAIMAIGAMSGISTNAIYITDENPFEAPLGYIEVDDKGQLLDVIYSPYEEPSQYVVYKIPEGQGADICIYYDFFYDYTVFQFDDEKSEAFEEIYSKYSDKLIFGHYIKYNDEAIMFDRYGIEGRPADAKDKFELVMQMTEELYKAGCIKSAEYKPLLAHHSDGYVGGYAVMFNKDIITEEEKQAEYDNLVEITSEFENGSVIIGSDRYMVELNFEDYVDWCEAVKEVYPDADFTKGIIIEMSCNAVASESINLLSAIGDIADDGTVYGDLNTDGRIGIADAIMMNKYINGSVVLNDVQKKTADLNGSGTIDSDDLNVMLEYLIDIIDEFPVSK